MLALYLSTYKQRLGEFSTTRKTETKNLLGLAGGGGEILGSYLSGNYKWHACIREISPFAFPSSFYMKSAYEPAKYSLVPVNGWACWVFDSVVYFTIRAFIREEWSLLLSYPHFSRLAVLQLMCSLCGWCRFPKVCPDPRCGSERGEGVQSCEWPPPEVGSLI